MKHILKMLLVCLAIVLSISTTKAQTTFVMEIDSVVALPDTIVDGNTVTFYMMVSQTGTPLFYQGNIYVEFEYGGNFYPADSTVSQGFINPNAPNQLQITHRFSSDDDLSIGDNVVVVWPRIGDGNDPTQVVVNPYETIVTLIEPNGIDQNPTDQLRFFYPNPATSVVRFENETLNKIQSISIFDTLGKCVLRSGRQSLLDISLLPNGIYLLRAQGNDGSVLTERLVVTH